MLGFVIGVLSGFTLCCLFSYVKILDKEIENKTLKEQCDKYKDFINTHQFYDEKFVKKEDDECDL